MTHRRESRDRKVVLAALTTAGPSGITPLGLAYFIDIPEDRVRAALTRLADAGLAQWMGAGQRRSPGRHDLYRRARTHDPVQSAAGARRR